MVIVEKLSNWLKSRSKEPWATFEVAGFEADGRIKVNFNWNEAFIAKLHALGFQAETDEDTVQLFFYASSMKPTGFAEEPAPAQVPANPWTDVT